MFKRLLRFAAPTSAVALALMTVCMPSATADVLTPGQSAAKVAAARSALAASTASHLATVDRLSAAQKASAAAAANVTAAQSAQESAQRTTDAAAIFAPLPVRSESDVRVRLMMTPTEPVPTSGFAAGAYRQMMSTVRAFDARDEASAALVAAQKSHHDALVHQRAAATAVQVSQRSVAASATALRSAEAALAQAQRRAAQQAAQAAAATKSAAAGVTAPLPGTVSPTLDVPAPGVAPVTVDSYGCPTSAPSGTLRSGAPLSLCRTAVAQARSPQSAAAIAWAFTRLGTPYSQSDRAGDNAFDCSSFVARAYRDGAGVGGFFDWLPNTAGYAELSTPVVPVAPAQARPGDIVILYKGSIADSSGNAGHAQLYLGNGWVIQSGGGGDSRVNVDQVADWDGWSSSMFAVTP